MGNVRSPRFLPKLPKDEREDARLPVVIGDGLVCFRGELAVPRPGDLASVRSGEIGGSTADDERRCCSSGGCCACCLVLLRVVVDFCSSCSITAAYSRSISRWFLSLSSSMTLSSNVTTLLWNDACLLCPFLPKP